jgi:hypothetical protein
VPELHADLVRSAVSGDTVGEWDWYGTQDGAARCVA